MHLLMRFFFITAANANECPTTMVDKSTTKTNILPGNTERTDKIVTASSSVTANLSIIPVDLNVTKKSRKPKPLNQDLSSVTVTGELSSLHLLTTTSSTETNETYAVHNEVIPGGVDVSEELSESSSDFALSRQEQSVVSNGKFEEFKLYLVVVHCLLNIFFTDLAVVYYLLNIFSN